jgi:hypothetical protein
MVKSRFGFRYGKSEILKLLRVPRGSVRGKCGGVCEPVATQENDRATARERPQGADAA